MNTARGLLEVVMVQSEGGCLRCGIELAMKRGRVALALVSLLLVAVRALPGGKWSLVVAPRAPVTEATVLGASTRAGSTQGEGT